MLAISLLPKSDRVPSIRNRSAVDIGRSQGTPETAWTHWRRRWGEDSRLIRHNPMDWTTGTPGTAGNDTLDSGDWFANAGDSWKRRRRSCVLALKTKGSRNWLLSMGDRLPRSASLSRLLDIKMLFAGYVMAHTTAIHVAGDDDGADSSFVLCRSNP